MDGNDSPCIDLYPDLFPAWALPTAAYTLHVALGGEKLRANFDPLLPAEGVGQSSGFYLPPYQALTIN
jgi:hypothetical protein